MKKINKQHKKTHKEKQIQKEPIPLKQNKPLSETLISDVFLPDEPLLDRKEHKDTYKDFILVIRKALMNEKWNEIIIKKMLNEIICGAYINRKDIYAFIGKSFEGRLRLQKQRQDADNHLLNVIKAVKDINRPSISVAIKQADQVNIADKQVNMTKSPNDLDTK